MIRPTRTPKRRALWLNIGGKLASRAGQEGWHPHPAQAVRGRAGPDMHTAMWNASTFPGHGHKFRAGVRGEGTGEPERDGGRAGRRPGSSRPARRSLSPTQHPPPSRPTTGRHEWPRLSTATASIPEHRARPADPSGSQCSHLRRRSSAAMRGHGVRGIGSSRDPPIHRTAPAKRARRSSGCPAFTPRSLPGACRNEVPLQRACRARPPHGWSPPDCRRGRHPLPLVSAAAAKCLEGRFLRMRCECAGGAPGRAPPAAGRIRCRWRRPFRAMRGGRLTLIIVAGIRANRTPRRPVPTLVGEPLDMFRYTMLGGALLRRRVGAAP
jgi:hypothetical protein